MFLKWLFHSFFSYFRLPTLPLPLQSQLMIFYYISLWNRSNSTEVDLPATNFPASVPTLFTFLPLNIYGVSLLLSKFFICTQHSISSNLFKDCVPGIILPCSSLNWVGYRNDLVSPPLILQLSPANTLFSFFFFGLTFWKTVYLWLLLYFMSPSQFILIGISSPLLDLNCSRQGHGLVVKGIGKFHVGKTIDYLPFHI